MTETMLEKMLNGDKNLKTFKVLKEGVEEVRLSDMKKNKDGSVECNMRFDGEKFVAVNLPNK
jgi:hypothetical protein